MRHPLAVVGLAAVCLSGSPSLQDLQNPKDRAAQPLVLDAGSYDVKEVFSRFAKYLGYNLLYENNDFQNPDNKLNLIGRISVEGKACEELFTQLAHSKDFAIVPVDLSKKLYQVIFIRGPKRPQITEAALFMMPAEVRENRRKVLYVSTVRKLKHVHASMATSNLRPFLASGGAGASVVQLGTVGTDDAVLLQGFAGQVAEALRLLDEIDQPSQLKLPANLEQRLQGIETRINTLENKARTTKKE
jgi:hypothetical protein